MSSPYIQESLCYVCPDVTKEFIKYDANPERWLKTFNGRNLVTKQVGDFNSSFTISQVHLTFMVRFSSLAVMHVLLLSHCTGLNWTGLE